MIDLTNLKSPGWQRVVAELAAGAPDDKAFFERLMRVMAQVSAARRATLMVPSRAGESEEIEPRVVSVWPEGGDGSVAEAADPEAGETMKEAKSAARAAFSSGAARAFGLDKQTEYYDSAPGQGYVLAVPLGGAPAAAGGSGGAGAGGAGAASGGAGVAAVITLQIEPRSKDAVRSTLAMAEVLAGYVHGHAARQQLRRTQAASFALDLATRLIASINTAPSFKGATIQLTNDLTKQFAVDRVALGWVHGDQVRVEAISDTEHFDRRMAMVQRLQAAMDECLDQEQPVLFPQPPETGAEGDVLLAQAIVHAHRELAAGDAKLKVCSLPLRIDEKVVGVMTVESSGQGTIDLGTIELIQAALDLVAPVLRIRRSDDRILALRAWDSTLKGSAWLVGPKHTVWKLASIAVFAAAIFVTFYTKTYRVGAEAVLQPRVKRVISAPFDGIIESIKEDLKPGTVVEENEVLVQMDTTELKLSLLDAQAKMAQAAAQESAALKERDTAASEKAHAQWKQAEAQAQFIEDRIRRSAIRAPIGGTVINGDLENRIGGTVKLGDSLIEVAKMDDIIAVAQVDDRDISLVRQAFAEQRRGGSIVAKSAPDDPLMLTVERIVPLATAKEGKNTFEVRARIEGRAKWMVPGAEGLAKFDTQEHRLIWIGTRRVVNAVRLWLW